MLLKCYLYTIYFVAGDRFRKLSYPACAFTAMLISSRCKLFHASFYGKSAEVSKSSLALHEPKCLR